MLFLLIVLNILESCLLFISALIKIPEWISILLGCTIIILLFYSLRLYPLARFKKITIIAISIISISWSLFSAYAMPYWNSTTILDVAGVRYTYSKDLDDFMTISEAQEDVDFAIKQILKIHPFFLEFPERKNSYREKFILKGCDSISVKSLYQHIQTRISLLHDAHTKVFPVLSNYHVFDYDKVGELVSINGVDKDSLRKYVSSESDTWAKTVIDGNICSFEWLNLWGLIDNGYLDIVFINSKGERIKHKMYEKDFILQDKIAVNSLSSDKIGTYYFDDATSSGILKLNNLYYYTLSQRKQFNNGVAAFFDTLVNKHYKQLIIDLRNNPGGNAAIASEIFKYFPIKRYSIGTRYHRYGRFYFKRHIVKNNIISANLCFKGNVYVLTSIKTFSGAMHLADYLQGNGVAKVVGESPGNMATCYTDISHFVLPNSRLSLTVSSAKFLRVNDSIVNKALIPDISCNSEDAYMLAIKDSNQ